jgi:hypothetical protein
MWTKKKVSKKTTGSLSHCLLSLNPLRSAAVAAAAM